MEDESAKVKEDLLLIKQRNQRVEADKAWETSVFRVVIIAIITYAIASVALYFIGIQNYLFSALIPSIGFILSTLSLPPIKRWWVRTYFKNKES